MDNPELLSLTTCFYPPMPGSQPFPADKTTPRLFGLLALALIGLALVPTVWPELDLAVAQWFAPPNGYVDAKSWWWVRGINLYIPAIFRCLVLVAIGLWIVATKSAAWRAWRLPLAFFILSGALGPGLVVNAGFKEHWQRARPYEVVNFGGTEQFTRAGLITDQCDNNCSFGLRFLFCLLDAGATAAPALLGGGRMRGRRRHCICAHGRYGPLAE